MRRMPNKVLSGFCNASGFFDGDQIAWDEANRLSKNQRRKLERYAIIPVAFYQYLARSGIIRECHVPTRSTKQGELLDFLSRYSYRTEQAKSDGIYIYEAILKAEIPFLARSFAKGDFTWLELERNRIYKIKKGADGL